MIDRMFDKYYTAAEVCEILKVDRRTLSNWRKAQFKGFVWTRVGNSIRYPKVQLIKWLEMNTTTN